jgi:hypothetical protein
MNDGANHTSTEVLDSAPRRMASYCSVTLEIIGETSVATTSVSPTPGARYIPDLNVEETRATLTPAAIEGFVRLVETWRLTSKQATALLAEQSERTWFSMQSREWRGVLSHDALTRISALIGVYKGLHLLFSDPLADEWVRLRNTETLFGGVTPVDYMIAGGIPAMLETRRYIDALRGGL